MHRHLSIQRQIDDFSAIFGPFVFLSVGLVCILGVFLFYGVIRQGSYKMIFILQGLAKRLQTGSP